LIIDDDPQHLQVESWILNQAGFRIITSEVGRNSISLPEHIVPGLIFLDYRLNTTLTSPQIVRLLRGTFTGVPIILVSNASVMPEEMTALVDGFISKTDPEELVRFAQNFFDGDGKAIAAHPSV
jgi:DNA-binding response OmpR family regulator